MAGIFCFAKLDAPSIFSRPLFHGFVERRAKGAFGAEANCPRDSGKRLIACLQQFACDLHSPVQEVTIGETPIFLLKVSANPERDMFASSANPSSDQSS